MKVYMLPDKADLGIQRVLDAYRKYLPQYGIEFVDSPDKADIVSVHVAEQSTRVDVAHCHGLYPTANENHNNLGLFQMNALVLDNIKKSSAFTVPSNWVADLFRHDMLLDPTVVPHGVDVDEFKPLRRKEHGNYVIWAKGHNAPVCDYSIVNDLAKAMPAYEFVSTVAQPADNVKVIGYQPYNDMKKWLAGAGVYLATTKETFGIQVLEAMALGIPVVGWNWGALPDIVQHKVQGYLAAPGNMQDLVQGVVWAMLNKNVIGERGIERAGEFNWTVPASIVAAVYDVVDKSRNSTKPVDVSVVIPCYNYEKYVGDAIKSVLVQDFSGKFEVIVVNDGSTDNSEAVIKQFTDVRYIKQANYGVAEARNNGIRHAIGEIIACLDADDEMYPHFLSKLYTQIADKNEIGVVYGSLSLKNEDGLHASKWPVPFDFSLMVKQENCVPSCTLFRKDAWFRAGGYRQQYAPCEDAELWLRIAALGYKTIMATSEPVYIYRLHDKGVSRIMEQTDYAKDKPWYYSEAQMPFGATPSEWVSYPVRNYDEPWVTIVIPVGPGHENLVSRAVDSIWLQDMPYWEVVVVNDSGHDLLHEATGYPLQTAYPFIRMYSTHKSGSGPAVARNLGASVSKAPFLLFLDADDGIMMECLTEMFRAYNENNGEAYVYSDWYSYDGTSSHLHETQEYDTSLLWSKALHPITALVPKVWFDEVGGFDETIPGWEDWELFIKIAKKHCGVRVPMPLMTYDTSAGKKREKDYANTEESLAAIRAKHKESEMCVTCRDKGRGRVPAQRSEPTQQQAQAFNAGDVLVADNSANRGLHPVRGVKTGKQYGHVIHGQQFMMNIADQRAQPHLYVVVSPAAPESRPVVERPVPPATPAEPAPEVVSKLAEPVKPPEQKPVEPAKSAEPELQARPTVEEEGIDISLLTLPQIRNLELDKETATVALEAEKAGNKRPTVIKYLDSLVNA